jgi:hypothetical protein
MHIKIKICILYNIFYVCAYFLSMCTRFESYKTQTNANAINLYIAKLNFKVSIRFFI